MEKTLLKDYPDKERGAYLCAIASIATADHQATPEELDHISELAEAADLNEQQKQIILRAASELEPADLRECLDVLKNSELRFSLVADLIAFAEADGHYSNEEKAVIERISEHLNINKEQYSLLDDFVHQSPALPAGDDDTAATTQGFMQQQGLTDKLGKAGINMGSLTKGLLAAAGPMLLSRLFSGGAGRRGGMNPGGMLGGGGIGGMLGGGGGGGMFGGRGGGGIGSIISMLSGGRGYGRSGGLLGRLF